MHAMCFAGCVRRSERQRAATCIGAGTGPAREPVGHHQLGPPIRGALNLCGLFLQVRLCVAFCAKLNNLQCLT